MNSDLETEEKKNWSEIVFYVNFSESELRECTFLTAYGNIFTSYGTLIRHLIWDLDCGNPL